MAKVGPAPSQRGVHAVSRDSGLVISTPKSLEPSSAGPQSLAKAAVSPTDQTTPCLQPGLPGPSPCAFFSHPPSRRAGALTAPVRLLPPGLLPLAHSPASFPPRGPPFPSSSCFSTVPVSHVCSRPPSFLSSMFCVSCFPSSDKPNLTWREEKVFLARKILPLRFNKNKYCQ